MPTRTRNTQEAKPSPPKTGLPGRCTRAKTVTEVSPYMPYLLDTAVP